MILTLKEPLTSFCLITDKEKIIKELEIIRTYTPHKWRTNNNSNITTNTWAIKGINTDTAQELVNWDFAIEMNNYRTINNWEIEITWGSTILNTVSAIPWSMIRPFGNSYMVFWYWTTVSKYHIATKTETIIKNNFPTSDNFDWRSYWDFFYTW